MSERLSDRDLDTIQASVCWLIDQNETAYVLPDALDAARIQIALVEEIRERRAADLSEQDRALLSIIRGEVLDMGILALRSRQEADPTFRFRSRDHEDEENAALTKRALALLDRLLSRGEGGR